MIKTNLKITGGLFMKKFKKFMVRYGSLTASLAMALSFWFSNKTCFFICHQPEEPEALKRLVKEREENLK